MYGIDRCHMDKLLCVMYDMYRIIIVNQKHQISIHIHQQPELRNYYKCVCVYALSYKFYTNHIIE